MPKILAFDGDCPMCGWIAERFGEAGLVAAAHRRPYQSFEGETARRMEEAGIRNEMLVLDEASGELRSGIAGFLWLLEDSRWSWARPLLALPPVGAAMRLVYRTIAYNRRILAPPAREIVCDCDPDPHAGFRALLLASLGLLCLAGGALFGWAVAGAASEAIWWQVALAAALAASLPLALLGWLSPLELFPFMGHYLVSLTGATLVAAPLLLLSLALDGGSAMALVVAAAALGFWRFVKSARWRLRRARPPGSVRAQPESDG